MGKMGQAGRQQFFHFYEKSFFSFFLEDSSLFPFDGTEGRRRKKKLFLFFFIDGKKNL